MVENYRLYGVTGGSKTGRWLVPTSKGKEFQQWLNETGGGYVDWSVTYSESALKKYGGKIEGKEWGMPQTQTVSQKVSYEATPPIQPATQINQVAKPTSFVTKAKEKVVQLGREAYDKGLIGFDFGQQKQLAPVGRFFERKVAQPIAKIFTPQDIDLQKTSYGTTRYDPTAQFGTIQTPITSGRTTLLTEIKRESDVEFKSLAKELSPTLSQKEWEIETGKIGKGLEEKYTKKYARGITEAEPSGRIMGGFALGLTGMGLLSGLGKTSPEVAKETIASFKIDPIGSSLSTFGSVAGGITLGYGAGKGVTFAKQKIADFKTRPQIIKAEGFNIAVGRKEGRTGYVSGYGYKIKAGKETYWRAAKGEVVSFDKYTGGRFDVFAPSKTGAKGVGQAAILSKETGKIGKVSLSQSYVEGITTGGKVSTAKAWGFSKKQMSVILPKGKIDTYSGLSSIRELRTPLAFKSGKPSVLGSKTLVVTPFEIKDVGGAGGVGTKVVSTKTTGVSPTIIKGGLTKFVMTTIPRSPRSVVSPTGTAPTIGLGLATPTKIAAVSPTRKETKQSTTQIVSPITIQKSTQKQRTTPISQSVFRYKQKFFPIQSTTTLTASVQVQRPFQSQVQLIKPISLQKQKELVVFDTSQTGSFQFPSFGYSTGGRGFFPLLPPLYSPPRSKKKRTVLGKQRRKYQPSIVGQFLDLRISKAPKGTLTGFEIRPLVGSGRRKKKKTSRRRKK